MKSPPNPRSATIQHRTPCHLRVCIKSSLLHTHAAKSLVCFWFQLEQMEQQLEKILDFVQRESRRVVLGGEMDSALATEGSNVYDRSTRFLEFQLVKSLSFLQLLEVCLKKLSG